MTGHIGSSKWLLCHQDTLGCLNKTHQYGWEDHRESHLFCSWLMIGKKEHGSKMRFTQNEAQFLSHALLQAIVIKTATWVRNIWFNMTYIKIPFWEIPINSGMTIRIPCEGVSTILGEPFYTSLTAHVNHCPLAMAFRTEEYLMPVCLALVTFVCASKEWEPFRIWWGRSSKSPTGMSWHPCGWDILKLEKPTTNWLYDTVDLDHAEPLGFLHWEDRYREKVEIMVTSPCTDFP